MRRGCLNARRKGPGTVLSGAVPPCDRFASVRLRCFVCGIMVLFPVADRLPPACRTRDAAVSHPADTIAVGLPPPIDLHRYTPGQFADLVMAYLAISPRHYHWAGPGGSAAGG